MKAVDAGMSEVRYLKLSFCVTLLVAAMGIVIGLYSGSAAIAFDGVYSLVDAAMTMLALFVSRLIGLSTQQGGKAAALHARFNQGVWHLEPLVVAFDGMMLIGIAGYAFVNAIMGIAEGGQEVDLVPALTYATLTCMLCFGMFSYGRRLNKRLGSDLVALDVKGWLMSASITAALLVAFVGGLVMRYFGAEQWIPFIDPVVLAVVSLAIIPVPLREVRQAVREILQLTPQELRAHVEAVARKYVQEQGYAGHYAYVAEIGRAVQIELWFVLPPDAPALPMPHWDALRDRIGAEIGGDNDHRWLTIVFTGQREWAQ